MTDTTVIDVEPGETLSGIADRYDVSVEALLRWNRINDPDVLLAGQQIIIHGSGDADSLASEWAAQVASGPIMSGAVALGMISIVVVLLLVGLGRALSTRTSRTVSPFRNRPGVLAGKAWVIDGDSIRVSGQEVRFAGLDAPEYDQVAKHQDGYWFGHGRRVKNALIQKIGGKQVCVTIEEHDKFGRAVGIVTCNDRDVGEWLVREGHAIAAYGKRYKPAERQARRDKRGMWGHAVNIDPRWWRHRNK